MKFSIIIATLNRTNEPLLMLRSLTKQTFKDFEVLLIDQNEDNQNDSHFKEYSNSLSLKHIKTETKGASNARNIGIQNASGEILSFPDDDCEFHATFLEDVSDYFKNNDIDGIVVTTKDKGDGKAISRLISTKPQAITKNNVLKTVVEAGIIVKARKLEGVIFDPNMGVGSPSSPYWSDEGPDFILRLLEKGTCFNYCPQFYMFHPNPVKEYNAKTAVRSYHYGNGRGYFLKKHNYGFLSIVYYLLIYVAGMVKAMLFLNMQMFLYFKNGFKGRYEGYFL